MHNKPIFNVKINGHRYAPTTKKDKINGKIFTVGDSRSICVAIVVDDLPPLVEVLHVLHGGVAEHPTAEEHDGADDHREDADAEGACDEGDHEAQGLPHPVVREGGFLLGREQGSIEGVNLKI